MSRPTLDFASVRITHVVRDEARAVLGRVTRVVTQGLTDKGTLLHSVQVMAVADVCGCNAEEAVSYHEDEATAADWLLDHALAHRWAGDKAVARA